MRFCAAFLSRFRSHQSKCTSIMEVLCGSRERKREGILLVFDNSSASIRTIASLSRVLPQLHLVYLASAPSA